MDKSSSTYNPFQEISEGLQNIEFKINSIIQRLNILESDDKNCHEGKPMTVPEAANFLNIKDSTLRSKVSRREIPFYKNGSRLYFLQEDLINHLKSGKKQSKTEIENQSYKHFK